MGGGGGLFVLSMGQRSLGGKLKRQRGGGGGGRWGVVLIERDYGRILLKKLIRLARVGNST